MRGAQYCCIKYGMLRLIQITCIVVTAAILYGLGQGFKALSSFFSADFPIGFIAGFAFAALLYLLICWIDPSSRPRGTAGQQKSFDNGID